MKKVTIIMPCYNVENFIEDAFNSILKQSRLKEILVIPVNDGSKDGTEQIIRRYEQKYPGTFAPIYRPIASGGPGKPRNEGLDKCTTPYVIFMDPDDRIYKDGYSTLLSKIEELDSDMVIGTRAGVLEKQGLSSKQWLDFNDVNYTNVNSYYYKHDLLQRRPVILKTIYKMSIINNNHFRFNEKIKVSEDEIFDMDFIIAANKISKVDDLVYLYTVARTDSITTKINIQLYKDIEETYDEMEKVLIKYFDRDIVDQRIWGLVRSFYLPKIFLTEPNEQITALEIIKKYIDKKDFYSKNVYQYPADYFYLESFKNNQLEELRDNIIATQKIKRKKAANATTKNGLIDKIRRTSIPTFRLLLDVNIGRNKPNDYWVFQDRDNKATDNAEALFRYVVDNKLVKNAVFIIKKDTKDFERLKREGYYVVGYKTYEHFKLLYNAKYLITSHCDNKIIEPWKLRNYNMKNYNYELIFLQHGIIRSDLSSWLGSKKFKMFTTSVEEEYNSILNNKNYRLEEDVLKLTGLARHDLLVKRDGEYICIFPTWRSYLLKNYDLENTSFYKYWADAITKICNETDIKVKFVLHSSLYRLNNVFSEQFKMYSNLEIVPYNDVDSFAELISNSKMFITDFSSISFDFLYLRKPVIYFNFPEEEVHSTNTGADFSIYEKLGYRFSETRHITKQILKLEENNFIVDDNKLVEINNFFKYNDNKNCQRIYNEILNLEK